MALIQGGSNSVNVANVSGNNLQVVLPYGDPAYIGSIRNFSENDPGDILGSALLRSPETSIDYRVRVGLDSIFDSEVFNYGAQNSSKHKYGTTTMTMAWGGGFLTTNASSITTVSTATYFATQRSFPILGTSAVYCEVAAGLSAALATNTTIDYGLFLPNAATPYAPIDGVYFRITSAGFQGVINNGGTETTTSVFDFAHTINKVYKFVITIAQEGVEFWIDDVLYGTLSVPDGLGAPAYSSALPFAIRHAIAATPAGTVVQLKVANYSISVADINNSRLWATQQVGMGLSSIQGTSAMTQGATANFTNSTAPTLATLSNTVAGYVTLGGNFQFNSVAGAETDYALFGYFLPAATTGNQAKNLVIRGVWLDTFITGAGVVTTTPTILNWSLGVGSSQVSLATAETTTGRAPRRVHLGVQSFSTGATAGAVAVPVDRNLDAPIVIEPGSYAHLILKVPVGTATAGVVFRGSAGVNGYWE